jgi:hypothetical protein
MRFELTVQSAGSIFNTWVDHMYFKFGQLSIWPHRDTIIKNMPTEFKIDFPNTLNPLCSVIALSDMDPVNSSDIKVTEPLGSQPMRAFKFVLDL